MEAQVLEKMIGSEFPRGLWIQVPCRSFCGVYSVGCWPWRCGCWPCRSELLVAFWWTQRPFCLCACLSLWSWLCGWLLWCFGCLLVGTTCPRICFLCWIASPKKYRHKIKGTLTLNDHFWEQLAVRLSYRAVLAFWCLLNPLSPGRTMGADAGHSMAPRKLNLIICWSYFHSKTSLSQFIETQILVCWNSWDLILGTQISVECDFAFGSLAPLLKFGQLALPNSSQINSLSHTHTLPFWTHRILTPFQNGIPHTATIHGVNIIHVIIWLIDWLI